MKKFHDIEFRDNFIFFVIILILVSIFFVKDYLITLEYLTEYHEDNDIKVLEEAKAQKIIADKADIAIKAIKFKSFATLSKIIHPKKGVRISPYYYVMQKDIVIKKNEFLPLYASTDQLIWGVNNNLKLIELTFADYYQYYLYADDFANYDEIYYNPVSKVNNIIDNTRQFYPKAIFVEYHIFDNFIDGSSGYRAILKLVFEEYRNDWYLTAIINVRGIT